MATPARRARTTTGTCNGRRPPPREARLRGQASAARAHDRAGGGGRARPREPVTDDVPRNARLRGQASTAPAQGHAGAPGAHDHGNLQRTTSPARPGRAARPPQRRPMATPRRRARTTTGTCGGRRRRAPRLGRAPLPRLTAGGLVGSTGQCGCTAACCGGSPQAAARGKPGQRRRKRRGGGACPRPAPLPWGAGLERRAYSSAALTAAGSARACTWRIRRTVLPPRMALIWRSS